MKDAAREVGCAMLSNISMADLDPRSHSQSPAKAACRGISASEQYIEKLVAKAFLIPTLGGNFMYEPLFFFPSKRISRPDFQQHDPLGSDILLHKSMYITASVPE
jgi:hypothetical protein